MSLEDLMHTLLHGQGESRLDAAEALGAHGDRKATGTLIQCLRDPNPALRALICESLGLLSDPRAVSPLVSMLRDDDESVRGEAFSALLMIGQARASKLPAELRSAGEDPSNPSLAVTQIVWPADLEAIKLLHDSLNDPDPEVRIGSAYTLGRLGIGGAFKGITTLLYHDPDPDVRAAAAFALGDLGESGDSRARDALLTAWQTVGEHTEVAVLVVRALANLQEPRAFTVFEDALRHADPRVRQLAIMGLAGLREGAAVPSLARMLRDQHEGVRRNAAAALGQIGHPSAIKPLITAAAHEGAGVRVEIGVALSRLDRATVHAALRATLSHADPELRQAAAYLMGQTHDADGLGAAMSDPAEPVRKAAALAIGNSNAAHLIPYLEAGLQDPGWTVRVACAEGLRRLGDPAAAAILRTVCDDPHPIVRNAVQVALRALGG